VGTTAACTWTAASSASWLTVSSGATGTGNGGVVYSVANNSSGTTRTATLTVAGVAEHHPNDPRRRQHRVCISRSRRQRVAVFRPPVFR
jgi:hypothetical protein